MSTYLQAQKEKTVPLNVASALLAGVVLAGTGGLSQPADVGYLPKNLRVIYVPRNALTQARVKEVIGSFNLSVVGLSKALNVSRQTVYNWLNGESPSFSKQESIDSLLRAYSALSKHNLSARSSLNQPIESRKNFWQLIQRGADPETVAARIVENYLKREMQRTLVAKRLSAKRAKGTLAGIDGDDLT